VETETVDNLGPADLVIGLLEATREEDTRSGLVLTREALSGLPDIQRAVLICRNGAAPAVPEPSPDQPSVVLYNLHPPAAAEAPLEAITTAYRSVLGYGEKLDARACGIVASSPRSLTPQWIRRLVQPIVELGFDLVAPRYPRHRMEGLLNRGILSPLFRALYGEHLQNPLGPDFGLSGRLLRQLLENDTVPRHAGASVVVSIASLAARSGFAICESSLGGRNQLSIDGLNLSSLLAQVLGPVFLDMERQAAFWQRIRASRPVPRFGSESAAAADEPGTVEIGQMIESFQLGSRNLGDVWGAVLPPSTLFELRKLSQLPAAQFRMPDDLWVRIVYDFALGHRLHNISRDHLLRSITPLYLGWIASYALELESAAPPDVEARLERLAVAFETGKPYLVSRWRWPDRFNP